MSESFLRRAAARLRNQSESVAHVPTRPTDDGNHWTTVSAMLTWIQSQHAPTTRANYTWSLLHCARIARTLGLPRVSALEFGVAGGNGLVAMETAAAEVEELLGVGIDVYGFDTGGGIPTPRDQRDAPYVISGGDFPMDEARLRARLRRSELVLGLVEETLPKFLAADSAPVGFVSIDLDYYTSTVAALALFAGAAERLLPRVICYFDDVMGYPWGDFNGERLAIDEFNAAHDDRKISPVYGLRYFLPLPSAREMWPEMMYVAHVLDHSRYAENEGTALVTRLDLGTG
ncbi:MAG: hypothetical protein ACJ735_02295 [Actinomycetes bacterium]